MSKEGEEACSMYRSSMMEEEVHATNTRRNAYRRRRMSVVVRRGGGSSLDILLEKRQKDSDGNEAPRARERGREKVQRQSFIDTKDTRKEKMKVY